MKICIFNAKIRQVKVYDQLHSKIGDHDSKNPYMNNSTIQSLREALKHSPENTPLRTRQKQ